MDIRNEKEELLEVTHVNNYYDDNGLGILRKRGKKQVLHDISFTIHTDEFFGLVGESGCGKSTLGNAILNLIPYEGSIRLDGRETSQEGRKEFTKKVQAVFQDPMSALNPRKTIGFTLREPLRAHGIGTPKEQMEEVNRMLERIGLDASYADRYPKELSGGQRQRVCIGAALMLNPELVIADEAVSALDVSVGAQILNLFRDIDRKRDFAMLFISHNLNVVYYLCDRIAVMYRGRRRKSTGIRSIRTQSSFWLPYRTGTTELRMTERKHWQSSNGNMPIWKQPGRMRPGHAASIIAARMPVRNAGNVPRKP